MHNIELCKENGVLLFKGDGMRAYIREKRKCQEKEENG